MYDVLATNTEMTQLPNKQYQSCTTPKIHREPIPAKILATNSTVPVKFAKNDLHSSISTAVLHKGEVLLAKNY